MRKLAPKLLLLLASPLLFFGLLEGTLYLTGRFQPLSILKQIRHQGRLFWISEPAYGRFVLQRPNAPPPQQIWLPVDRDPERLRVVMLGESAVAGFPLEEYNLGRMTRVLWDERFPQEPMEMATLAMTGINSHILRGFAREAMMLDPDILILYIGHNEVIGPYGPISRFAGALPSENLAQLSLQFRNTRTGRAIEQSIDTLAAAMASKQDSKWLGMDEYSEARMPADDPALDRMLAQTRANFRAIIRTALDHGCKVLVCVPAVNLTDWPPMATAQGSPEISAQAAYDKARELEAAGRRGEAWKYYRQACDLDLLRFRADSRVRQLQRDLVEEFHSPDVAIVDADLWLHERNPGFRSDSDFFLEHVHPTFEGRVAIASLMVDGLAALTGHSPPIGEAGSAAPDPAAWWQYLPARIDHARSALFYSDFAEAQMWAVIDTLLDMTVFDGLEDRDQRRQAASRRADELFSATRNRWTPDRIRQAHLAASKQNADEWVDHSAAELWDFTGQRGDYLAALQAAHKRYPYFRLVRRELAQTAILEGRYEEALDHLRTLEKFRPGDHILPQMYGNLYWAWGQPDKAIPFLEKHAANEPKDSAAWFNLGMAFQMSGDFRSAANAFRRCLAVDSDHLKACGTLAQILLEQKNPTPGDKREALDLARRMLDLQADSFDIRLLLAVALVANGQTAEAQSTIDALVARSIEINDPAAVSFVQKTFQDARAKFQK